MDVKFSLVAQVTPINAVDWADQKKGISTLREQRDVTIRRPFIPPKVIEKTLKLEMKIGGFLGIGTKPCTLQATFDRDQYCPGDEARVIISCDNSACKKDVEAFKMGLEWAVSGHAHGTNQPTTTMGSIH